MKKNKLCTTNDNLHINVPSIKEEKSSKKVIIQKEADMTTNFLSIENMPSLCIAKDVNSRYSVISNQYARLLGWKNSEQCSNLTDFDIPCSAVDAAELFINLDKKVVNLKTDLTSLYVCKYANGWKTLLSNKIPILKKNGEITGVFGQVMDISNTGLYNWILPLYSRDQKFADSPNEPRIYILSQEHSPLQLTSRQQACIFFLMRGKTMKEIASDLKISIKTVEGHLERIKLKLGCNSKSQIIEKCINNGLLHYIPQDLFIQDYISH